MVGIPHRAPRLLFLLLACVCFVPSVGAAAPTPVPNTTAAAPSTRLDEVGRMLPPVPSEEVSAWKQELKTTHPTAERGAWLHLWLGEWELAQNEQPAHAAWHFRQAQHLTNPHHRCFGLAAYDQALALFYEGAYGEATDAFAGLLQPKKGFPGYDRRNCALWLRHAQACANYHAEHAKLSIPEPARLDPFCGAASLAACLRSLSLAYDRQTVLKACVVTGEGSSLQDVLNAGRKLGLNARLITADDAGLKALPKPLMAYVEQDHFVALVRADNAGVSYLCSDCGPWPGGRVDLTWAQWHALNPGVYAVVTKPGSKTDTLLREALAARKPLPSAPSATQVSFAGPLSALRLKAHFSTFGSLSALRGHVNDYQQFAKAATCGHKPEALHCLSYVHCPTVSPAHGSPHGPLACDPVNLATGEEEYTPEPDLVVYNPIGPSVSWSRIYNSLRDQVVYPDHNPVDYGVGWSYSYNLRIYAPNGFNEPYGYIYVVFPNGSATQIGNTTTGVGSPGGAPFAAEGLTNTSRPIVLTMPDHSRWSFGQGSSSGNYLYLSQITDRNGHSIYFNYDANSNLNSITDDNRKTLLAVANNQVGDQTVADCYDRTVYYHTASFGAYSYPELTSVSEVMPTDNPSSTLPSRYAYNYANVPSGDGAEVVPFLHTITVPSPTGSGTSTATIWYLNQPNDGVNANPNYSAAASSGPFVSAIVDSNGNTTTMTPLSGANQSQVQVKDVSGKVLRTSRYGFDPQMRLTSVTDYNLNTVQTLVYNNDPYRPSSVTDGNGNSWSFTWGPYGHLVTETPPHGGAFPRAPAMTNYTYDYSYFKMGELTQIQTDGKKATTITYDHTKGYRQTYNSPLFLSGYIQSITTPQPGQPGINNSASISSSFLFDGYGNLTSLTTPGNNATIVNGTDQGITTTFNYTSDGSYSQTEAIGQPLTMKDNLGHVTHFRYDALGRSLSVTDALGYSTSQGYNLADQPLQVTRPATGQTGSGQSYTVYSYQYVGGPLAGMTAYDESNNAVRQVSYQYGPEGETLGVGGSTEPAQYAYDGLYRLAALADGNGHATHYYFNPNGYLDSVTYPGYTGPAYPNVGGPDSVHYPQYDGNGNPLRRIDGNGVETDYTYNDPESLLTNIHYPGGQLADVSYIYDAYGRVSSMTDGTGVTRYEGSGLPGYDDLDNPLAVQTAYNGILAQTIGYSYFNDGSRNTMTVPGRTYTYGYDAAGRFTSLTNGIGESASWSYQDNNWPLSQTDSNGNTVLQALPTYNALGQLTDLQNIAAGGVGISEFGDPSHGNPIRHDGVGNTLSVTSYLGSYATTNYTYDGRDQLIQETTNRNGLPTNTFGYDIAGNPLVLRGIPSVGYNFDNQSTMPNGITPAFISDGNGNPGAAHGAALTFDPENRLTAAGAQTAAVPTAIATGGDGLTRLLWNNANGSITLSLVNSSGSVISSSSYGPYPGYTAIALSANAFSASASTTHILWTNTYGSIIIWNYNTSDGSHTFGQYGPYPGWTPVAIADGPDGLTRVLLDNADGRIQIWSLNNGNGQFTQNTFGPYSTFTATGLSVGTDNTTHVLWNSTNGAAIIWNYYTSNGSHTFGQYGPYSGWTAKTIADGTDGQQRILWGNTNGQLCVWNLNNSTGVPTAESTYGPYGGWTATSISVGPDNEGHVLWDNVSGAESLWSVGPSGTQDAVQQAFTLGTVPSTGATFGYTGDGLRAWKQTSAGTKTYYLYDGTNPVAEMDSSGTIQAVNTFGANGLVSRSTPSGGTTFYAFDERGNVSQRVGGNGALLSTDLYDAFGNKRAGPADVFGFGGQAGYYTDAETGLILCTNRHYDPQQGRFLTRDPIGYDGGINLYSYTRNNPINWMDPDGTDALDNAIMAVSITAGGIEGGIQGGALGGGLGTLVEPVGGTFAGGAAGVYAGAGFGAAIGAGVGGLVIAARHGIMNMASGGGGGIETGPESSGGPYSHLQDPPNVGAGKDFEPAQKEAIYQENMRRNGGVIRADDTGEELQRVGTYKGGQKLPTNAAQIDHIIPKKPADPTVAPGTNSYSNARVISRVSNRAKLNSCPSK